MHKVLIVANETIGGHDLAAAVADRLTDGECTFHLVVPVPPNPPSAVAVGLAAIECAAAIDIDPANQHEVARQRLACGIEWLQGLGAQADGEVGPSDGVSAVCAVIERERFDEIIVSTLPSRISKWLRQDLPHRIERKVDVPVAVVTAGAPVLTQ